MILFDVPDVRQHCQTSKPRAKKIKNLLLIPESRDQYLVQMQADGKPARVSGDTVFSVREPAFERYER